MVEDPRRKLSGLQRELLKHSRQEAQRYVTDAELAESWEKCLAKAKGYFAEHGEHMHMFIAHLRKHETGEHETVVMAMPDWPPPKGKKEMTLMGMGVNLAQEFPHSALLMVEHISEGWAASQPDYKASGKEYIGDMDAGRTETLTVSLTTIDCRQSYSCEVILRDEAGKFKEWGTPVIEDIYDPAAEIEHIPTDSGDFLSYAIIKGYCLVMAEKVRRRP